MRQVLIKTNLFIIKSLRYFLRYLMSLDRQLNQHFDQKNHNLNVVQSTRQYDMVSAADEAYYVTQYWNYIEQFLTARQVSKSGFFLDAGCGQGRMSIPFAKWIQPQGKMIAVDLSLHAIEQAKHYATKEQLDNIEFIASDLLVYLKAVADNVFDGVFLLEIVFFLPNYRQVLKEIIRVLKPNGFFIGSFRSQYFNLLHSMRNGLWRSVDMLLDSRSGPIVGGATQFNWHTLSELKDLLQTELGLEIDCVFGIGGCSGIPGDPHDGIKPSMLSQQEQQLLMKAEAQVGRELPEVGRYILIAAHLATHEKG